MSKNKRGWGRFPFSLRGGCSFVALMIVGILGMTAIMVWGFSNLLSPLGDRGNAFLTALKEGHDDAAYAMLSDKFQQNETAQDFTNRLKELTSPPTDWKFSSFSIVGIIGRIKGRVTFDGQEYNLTIHFVYEKDRWAVSGFDFDLYQETRFIIPTATPVPTTP